MRVQPQSVIQVRGATLWLANDIEIRKAPHAVEFPVAVKQMFSESVPQVLKHSPEAPWVACIQVCPVGVRSDIPSVFLVPAGVLDTRQEFAWDNRKHLQRQSTEGLILHCWVAGFATCTKIFQTKLPVNLWNYHCQSCTTEGECILVILTDELKQEVCLTIKKIYFVRGKHHLWSDCTLSTNMCRRIQTLGRQTCSKLALVA